MDNLNKSLTSGDSLSIEAFLPEIFQLVDKFSKSGQSGGSAPYVASAISNTIKKLLMFEPLSPITNNEDDWINFQAGDESYLTHKRCSKFFKTSDGINMVEAIQFQGEDAYDCFTGTVEGVRSSQLVTKFPIVPKKFVVNVYKELLPAEHTEEPFYEFDYYSKEEFDLTGIKNWVTEKYRYKIKDMNQVQEVINYYN